MFLNFVWPALKWFARCGVSCGNITRFRLRRLCLQNCLEVKQCDIPCICPNQQEENFYIFCFHICEQSTCFSRHMEKHCKEQDEYHHQLSGCACQHQFWGQILAIAVLLVCHYCFAFLQLFHSCHILGNIWYRGFLLLFLGFLQFSFLPQEKTRYLSNKNMLSFFIATLMGGGKSLFDESLPSIRQIQPH